MCQLRISAWEMGSKERSPVCVGTCIVACASLHLRLGWDRSVTLFLASLRGWGYHSVVWDILYIDFTSNLKVRGAYLGIQKTEITWHYRQEHGFYL